MKNYSATESTHDDLKSQTPKSKQSIIMPISSRASISRMRTQEKLIPLFRQNTKLGIDSLQNLGSQPNLSSKEKITQEAETRLITRPSGSLSRRLKPLRKEQKLFKNKMNIDLRSNSINHFKLKKITFKTYYEPQNAKVINHCYNDYYDYDNLKLKTMADLVPYELDSSIQNSDNNDLEQIIDKENFSEKEIILIPDPPQNFDFKALNKKPKFKKYSEVMKISTPKNNRKKSLIKSPKDKGTTRRKSRSNYSKTPKFQKRMIEGDLLSINPAHAIEMAPKRYM